MWTLAFLSEESVDWRKKKGCQLLWTVRFFVFMSVDREQGGAHYYFNIPVVKSVVKMLGGNYSCHLIL